MVEENSQILERIKLQKPAKFSIVLENTVQELVDNLDITLTEEQIQCLLILRKSVFNSDIVQTFEEKKMIDNVFPIKTNKELLGVIVWLLDKTIFDNLELRVIMLAFLDNEELEEIMVKFQDRDEIFTKLEKLLKLNSLSSLEEKSIREAVEIKLLEQLIEIFKIWWNISSEAILDYLSSIEDLDIEKDFEKISFLARLAVDKWDNTCIIAIYNFFIDYISRIEDYNLVVKIEKLFTWMNKDLIIEYDLDKAIYNIENVKVQDMLIATLIWKIKSNLFPKNKNGKVTSSFATVLKSIVEMTYYKDLYLNVDYMIEGITQIISENVFDNISIRDNEEIYIIGYNLGLTLLILDSMKPKTISHTHIKRAEILCGAVSTPLYKFRNINR